jgi:malonyl-CoA O-methyltransferase
MRNYLTPNQHPFWQWLRSELSERMAENLPFIKIDPQKILLLGGQDKKMEDFFLKTYRNAMIWSDNTKSKPFLAKTLSLFQKYKINDISKATHEDLTQLDFVWAGPLCMKSIRYPEMFLELGDSLRTQGLLMFNYLGPDTAKEYRPHLREEAWIGPDMHDIGDSLLKAGFGDPVMNMELITLEYESLDLMMKDLRGINLIGEGSHEMERFRQFLENAPHENRKLKMTLEVVYGHAWKVEKKIPGITTISPEKIGKKHIR